MYFLRMGIGYFGKDYADTGVASWGYNSISWNMMSGDYILLKQHNITWCSDDQQNQYASIFAPVGPIFEEETNLTAVTTSLIWKITCRQPNDDPNQIPYLEISMDGPYVYNNGQDQIDYKVRHSIKSVVLNDLDRRLGYYDFWTGDGPAGSYISNPLEVNALPWNYFNTLAKGLIGQTPMLKIDMNSMSMVSYSASDILSPWYINDGRPTTNFEGYNELIMPNPISNPDGEILSITKFLKKYESFLDGTFADTQHNYHGVVDNGYHAPKTAKKHIWAGPINLHMTDSYAAKYRYDSILSIISGNENFLPLSSSSMINSNMCGWFVPSKYDRNTSNTLFPLFYESIDRSGVLIPFSSRTVGPNNQRYGSLIIFDISETEFGFTNKSSLAWAHTNTINCPGLLIFQRF